MRRIVRVLCGLVAAMPLVAGSYVPAQQVQVGENKEFEILKNLEIFSSVYKTVELTYVDDVNTGELMKAALDAMLEKLDPYTVYIPEADIEDYRIMTEGEYGGIGSTIHYRDGWVYISDPYKGFPADLAGLKPGDKILSINGESTEGKTVPDVSAMLKGQAGTSLVLQVERAGEKKPMEVTLTRKEIRIKNVTYSGMLSDSVGYIRQDGFTEGAANEVKEAFLKLKEKGMKYLVYDLRYNGGGLLNEAVDIVNLFYRKGVPVVSTKGRIPSKNHTYYTTKAPLDTEIPIVFLTSRATASASEILTGAMQDYDRALLVGERTFGKGLVQNILPLPYNAQMKVTVAKYYIPSGRCVQAIDYTHKDADGKALPVPDSLRTAFKTASGRVVYDGDGIEPDFLVESPAVNDVMVGLIAKFGIFDYANYYASRHASIGEIRNFVITDAIYSDFLEFMKTHDYSYKLASERALEEFEKMAKRDSCFMEVRDEFDRLRQELAKTKDGDLVKHRKEISHFLREEIVSRYYYQEGRAEAELQGDETVLKAVSILLDKDENLIRMQLDKHLGKSADLNGKEIMSKKEESAMNVEWMKEAVNMAVENIKKGGGPFAALIVKDGKVIARTGNTVTLTNDPTAHAEVNAIRQACKELGTFDLSGCEIYSSCEPCPMCLSAIYWANIDRIYFSGSRHDAAEAGFDDQFLYDEIGKDLPERKIPVTVLIPVDGKQPFEAWEKYEGKVEY